MRFSQSNQIVCASSREAVYQVICDSKSWPDIFEPCTAVEHLAKDNNSEHIQIKAKVNDGEMTWESYRVFYKDIYAIHSKVLKPMKFVKSMDIRWQVISFRNGGSLILLEHDYDILEDIYGLDEQIKTPAEAANFIAKAIKYNSNIELNNIKQVMDNKLFRNPEISKWSVSHCIICYVSANHIYSLIKDTKVWPKLFNNCVSTHTIKEKGNFQVIEVKASVKNKIICWQTHRTYYDDIYRINFTIENPMPLLKSLHGEWRVVPLGENSCLLNVNRYFELLDDINGIYDEVSTHENARSFIEKFVEENAENEMQSIKAFSECGKFNFFRSLQKYYLEIEPDKCFEIFKNISQWPQILPHCRRLDVLYDDGVNQEFIMFIQTSKGDSHQIRSVRNCQKDNLRIEYFQPEPMPTLESCSGSWVFKPINKGTEITSEHKIYINEAVCESYFNDNNLLNNKNRIKNIVVENSQSTVNAFKNWLSQTAEITIE